MCGIAGILRFNGQPVSDDLIQAMTGRMVHRGPDDKGFLHDRQVALGMRRLSIIDVAGGHQPLSNEDGSVWLVMNGEIYNHLELRQDLIRRGHQFKTGSDAEVILHLYEEKGVDAVVDLNGMFGFALWDSKRQALWVARDRLGIKPVFYSKTGEQFVFASDMSAMRVSIKPNLRRDSVLKYLALAYVPNPETIFEGIDKLPPAHYLWVEGGRVECRCYWRLQEYGTWGGSVAEAAKHLEELLLDSVRLQLRSDVPVGIFLSGGLDSSAIVALTTKVLGEPPTTLTIDFEGKGGDDGFHARTVADRYRTRHHHVLFSVQDALKALMEVVGYLDEPLSDSAILPTYLLSAIARDEGIKVLLTGAGGDELFGGYERHWPARFGSPAWVADSFPEPLRRVAAGIWSVLHQDRGLRAMDPAIAWGVSLSGTSLATCRQLLREQADFARLIQIFRDQFNGLQPSQRQLGFSYGRMAIDLRTYLVDDVLSLSDKATMAASVEGRVPLLDHRLVEYVFSLPSQINLLDGRPKGLFKHVLSGYLSPELIGRRKEGFNAPMAEWVQGIGSQVLERELLDDTAPITAELIDRRRLSRLLGDSKRQKMTAETLFNLFVLNRWSNTHLDS